MRTRDEVLQDYDFERDGIEGVVDEMADVIRMLEHVFNVDQEIIAKMRDRIRELEARHIGTVRVDGPLDGSTVVMTREQMDAMHKAGALSYTQTEAASGEPVAWWIHAPRDTFPSATTNKLIAESYKNNRWPIRPLVFGDASPSAAGVSESQVAAVRAWAEMQLADCDSDEDYERAIRACANHVLNLTAAKEANK